MLQERKTGLWRERETEREIDLSNECLTKYRGINIVRLALQPAVNKYQSE
jgi:hypothetical protein